MKFPILKLSNKYLYQASLWIQKPLVTLVNWIINNLFSKLKRHKEQTIKIWSFLLPNQTVKRKKKTQKKNIWAPVKLKTERLRKQNLLSEIAQLPQDSNETSNSHTIEHSFGIVFVDSRVELRLPQPKFVPHLKPHQRHLSLTFSL